MNPQPLMQMNPCVNGRFDTRVATLFPPVTAQAVITCRLEPHNLLQVTASDNQTMAQIDDVIGMVTISLPKASSYTFWHNINWTSNVALNEGDKLALWVSYDGWDQTNKTTTDANPTYPALHLGTIVTFHDLPQMPLHPTFRRTWNSNGMMDLDMLAMTATTPEEIVGDMLPTKSFSAFLNGEGYVRATENNWASYQMGIVAPFSMLSNPVIKYGDQVTYKVGFAYFGNQMGPRTPYVTPEDLMPKNQTEMDMPMGLQEMTPLTTNLSGTSGTKTTVTLVDDAVALTMSGVALAVALLSF
jgi:hypothetical protein